ncbi:MAG: hypothetical protein JSS22_04670, partial [Proteobacteria bacterium]|nr:hypothetical protein [Pseudomonadota bacterium]
LERVQRIITNYLQAMTMSPMETFILIEDGAMSPDQTIEIISKRKWLETDLRRQIALGIKDGSIAPCDPRFAVFVIVGALAWTSKWFDPRGAWTGEIIAIAMGEMLGRMLSATPAERLAADIARLRPFEPAG